MDIFDIIRWFVFNIGIFLTIGISIFFYVTNKSQKNIIFKILSSIHGFFGSLLFLISFIMWITNNSTSKFLVLYQFLYIIPIISIFLSFFLYKGNKIFLTLHIINIICLIYYYFYGLMYYCNQWL